MSRLTEIENKIKKHTGIDNTDLENLNIIRPLCKYAKRKNNG